LLADTPPSSPLLPFCFAQLQDEIDHVAFLRSALGDAAVAQPPINLASAFGAAADAAVGSTLSPTFSPYANDLNFFLAAFILEDVGVTAYKVRQGHVLKQ